TQQFRSANALPREFSLFEADGEVYMAAKPVSEVKNLVSDTRSEAGFDIVGGTHRIENIDTDGDGAFELQFSITPAAGARKVNFDLVNGAGEALKCYLDLEQGRIVMDRTEAGVTDLNRHGQPYNVHEREVDEHRKVYSVNYKNDWALGTWAPLNLCKGTTYEIDIFVDKCSVEMFVDGGRIAMTNLVFPSQSFNAVEFASQGDARVSDVVINQLGK
ncbi:MAG: GH32 C-terminal domain-containing protein, partial [Muribaculaceae bacterium]